MSAVDIVARGLAVGAQPVVPARFTEMGAKSFPANLLRIDTDGYATSGKGAGSYVSDALCTDELAAEHPRFVVRTAGGRLFRLLPVRGAISVEQGGAAGDGTADDRPAIQATIDYAAAVGIAAVDFGSREYNIVCPIRTSPISNQFAEDGHPIVIRRSVALRGIADRPSRLAFRGHFGGDPNDEYQLVAVNGNAGAPEGVWRGGGIFLSGDYGFAAAPDELAIDRFEMHRMVLSGGRVRTDKSGWPSGFWPANPATGDGWDDTDRALWMQDVHIGDVILRDVDMIGWRGEIYYSAASTQRSLELERVRLLHSNGNALNPGAICPLIARDCEFGDAFQAQEDTGKYRAQYIGCTWRDAEKMNIGSGPADGLLYNYLYPTRDESKSPPLTLLDGCTMSNVDICYVGCWTRGHIKTVDTQIMFPDFLFRELRDIELEIDAWLDQKNGIEPLIIVGPDSLTQQVGGAPAGTYHQPPRNIRAVVRAQRTELAARNGRIWNPVSWSGYVHHTTKVVLEDCVLAYAPKVAGNPLSMPLIAMRNFLHGDTDSNPVDGARYSGDIASNTRITPYGPLLSYSFSPGRHTLDLAGQPAGGTEHGYAHGQVFRLFCVSNAANPGDGLFFDKTNPYNGLRLKRSRLLSRVGDYLEVRFNRHYRVWEEVAFYTTRTQEVNAAVAAQTLPTVAPGATQRFDTIVSGALPGDRAEVSFSADLQGLIAFAEVSANDVVKTMLFNPTDTEVVGVTAAIDIHLARE